MKTAIVINDLRVYAYHGVLPQERIVGAFFRVSLEVEIDRCPAVETDRLEDTFSYADMADIVREEMAIPSSLVEHVAGRIARRIQATLSQTAHIVVEVLKEHPPMSIPCASAGVRVEV